MYFWCIDLEKDFLETVFLKPSKGLKPSEGFNVYTLNITLIEQVLLENPIINIKTQQIL